MEKNVFLCLVAFLLTTSLIGQQSIFKNKTTGDKNSATLYIGIDNVLEPNKETFIDILPQDGVFPEHTNIVVKPKSIGKLTIVFITKEGENAITFNVKRIPDVMPSIGGQTNKEVKKNVLLNQGQVTLKTINSDDPFFNNYKIIFFKAILHGHAYNITGNNFSSELLSEIGCVKSGDIFTVSDLTGFKEKADKTFCLKSNFTFNIQ